MARRAAPREPDTRERRRPTAVADRVDRGVTPHRVTTAARRPPPCGATGLARTGPVRTGPVRTVVGSATTTAARRPPDAGRRRAGLARRRPPLVAGGRRPRVTVRARVATTVGAATAGTVRTTGATAGGGQDRARVGPGPAVTIAPVVRRGRRDDRSGPAATTALAGRPARAARSRRPPRPAGAGAESDGGGHAPRTARSGGTRTPCRAPSSRAARAR